MKPIQLKISDLAAVADYTRFQLRGLLDEVFPETARVEEKPRSQRTFSPQDLLVISVVCELEKKYGVKRSVLARASTPIGQTLSGPRKVSRDARLVVTFTPPTATYVLPDARVSEGIVVPLGPLFARVDEYLGVSQSPHSARQTVLPLTTSILPARRGSSGRAR